jgi:uncharacterized OB-fold protein
MAFDAEAFQSQLEAGRLMGARCKDCDQIAVPPRPLCRSCRSTRLEPIPLSGNGTLRAFTFIAVAPPAMAARGYGRNNPYVSGVVELAEGCLAAGRIVGVDTGAPERLQVGTAVEARFIQEGEETILAFAPRN